MQQVNTRMQQSSVRNTPRPRTLKCSRKLSIRQILTPSHSEVAIRGYSLKQMFLKISQENTCVEIFFFLKKETPTLVFSSEYCEQCFYRTPLVAASGHCR